ncbi:unnamed protein product [Nesidiocoris tenuis]|uniref:Endonuclease n=1 Tax=Nesidiocoris tenuis TaxID=355587 RepID=A0A6H5GD28_9HEMI|nr:unnamed protein product [Nesidiocoris tenuis]
MASGLPIPQLTSTNYSNWRFRVETLLDRELVKDVIFVSNADFQALSKEEKLQFQANDRKARSVIVPCISDRHIEYVRGAQTAHEMMESLKKIFERKSTFAKLHVMRKLLKAKCETDDLQDHFGNIDRLLRELEAAGAQVDESDKACYLLLSMPEKYDVVITAIETMTTEITLDFVKSRLLDAELKFKENLRASNSNSDVAFSAQNLRCYVCGDRTHLRSNCPRRKVQDSTRGRSNNRRGRARRPKAYFSQDLDEENYDETDNIAFISEVYSAQSQHSYRSERSIIESAGIDFVLDSGATENMVATSVASRVTDIQTLDRPIEIRIANGKFLRASQRGKLPLFYGDINVTLDVLVVPHLTRNLLSVQKVNKNGGSVVFEKNRGIISFGKSAVVCAMKNGLFIASFEFDRAMPSCNLIESALSSSTCSSKSALLWHRRLSHPCNKYMRVMNLPELKEACGPCREGKATRLPFMSRPLPRTSRIAELLWSDVAGPIRTPTRNGERFFSVIIDDFSHMMTVHLLKKKSDAARVLMDRIRQLNASGHQVSRIRVDNGGEFSSHELKNFCSQKGINLEYTLHYTSQQNGASERGIRAVLDKVRTMLSETQLPKHLWGEAARCAAYLMNRTPTSALPGFGIPHKTFFGRVNHSKIRIFGSRCWAYKLPNSGDKIDSRAEEVRLVGYAPNGYRVWNPTRDHIYVSRDVRFDETDFIYKKPDEQQVSTVLPIIGEGSSPIVGSSPVVGSSPIVGSSPVVGSPPVVGSSVTVVEERPVPEDSSTIGSPNTRPNRDRKLPSRLQDFEVYSAFCLLTESDPTTYEEAMNDKDWSKAIEAEIKSHEEHGTWEPAVLPKDKKAIGTRWVFKTKQDGVKKARLVAKGFMENSSFNNYSQQLFPQFS